MGLQSFFNPKSAAVIGASRASEKPGHVTFVNMLANFKGPVYPVNPNADEIEGHKCYKSILDVPGDVEFAVLAVTAELCPQTLLECKKKGVKAAVILSGGFGEVGNTVLDKKMRDAIKKTKIRVIGPNCLGVYDSGGVNTFFLPKYRTQDPKPGPVAFVTQSGAVGGIGLDWAAAEGIGISKVISYGNKMDVDEVEMLEELGKDENTKVIMLYVEQITRGREFVAAAKKITQRKPIVAFKAGRTREGATAVLSHTGSLAGEAAVYDAAFREAGIITANSMEQMFDFAKAFAHQPPECGNRVTIVTSGGGFGIMAVDAVKKNGLVLAAMKKQTIEGMKRKFPAHVVVQNPVDLTGDADAHRYKEALEAVLKDPNVDGVVLILLFQLPKLTTDVVPIIGEILRNTRKPVVGVSAGSSFSEVHKKLLEEVNLPIYPTPERAVEALAALANFGRQAKVC